MFASRIRSIVLVAGVAACALFAAGCYVDAEVEPHTVMVDGYRPQYYDGYVVYYDNGVPYYYSGGSRYWVPRTYHGYYGLTNHYSTYHRGYNSWYTRGGHRYKTYRHTNTRYRYR